MDLEKISYIVEGTDGVGKSTIIKELMSRNSNLEYYHFEHPLGDNRYEKYGFQWGQFDMMFKFIKMTIGKVQYVFDRAHIGEYIWGPEFRERFPVYMPLMEDAYALNNLPIVLIHVDCDTKEIQHRLHERGNETVPDLDVIQFRRDQFRIYCERSPFPTFTVDTTNAEPTVQVRDLLQEIENYESRN
jgi:deoxyadenosine/deoxycytidine kinase